MDPHLSVALCWFRQFPHIILTHFVTFQHLLQDFHFRFAVICVIILQHSLSSHQEETGHSSNLGRGSAQSHPLGFSGGGDRVVRSSLNGLGLMAVAALLTFMTARLQMVSTGLGH